MNISCPVCGSERLSKKTNFMVINEPYAGNLEIQLNDYYCNVCEFEGSLDNSNDVAIKTAQKHLKQKSMTNILEFFSANNYNFASMERVLGLPQRTLTKWKSNQVAPSAAAISLFKFLRTFPWLLNIAEEKFDYRFAQNFFMKGAMNQLVDMLNPGCDIDIDLFNTPDYKYLIARIQADPKDQPLRTLETTSSQDNVLQINM